MPLSDCVILTATEPVDSSLAISVTLTPIVLAQAGVNVPALQGTWTAPADTRVIGVQFEYQEAGANATRTAMQGVGLLKWVATDGLIAGKVYAVRYRAVGADRYGDWTTPTNRTLSSTLTATEVINQGDLATLDQIDTPQVASKAVHQIGSIYSDSLVVQVNQAMTTNFGNLLLEITVTTTNAPVFVDLNILDAIVNNQDYYYYLHIDSTFQIVGTNEINHYDELKMRFGATATAVARNTRTFRWLVAGLSAGSHTFRVYLRNTSGGTMEIDNRSLTITEMKKAT